MWLQLFQSRSQSCGVIDWKISKRSDILLYCHRKIVRTMVEINKTRSSRLYLLKLSFQWGQSNFSTAVGWTSIASQSCTHRLFSIRSTHLFRQIYQIWTIHCHLIYEYCSSNCFRINFTYKICKLMTIIYSNLVTLKKLTSYLSALDFWHSPVWNYKFDELDFFPTLSLSIVDL